MNWTKALAATLLALSTSLGCAVAQGHDAPVPGQTGAQTGSQTGAQTGSQTGSQVDPALWKVQGVHGSVYLFGSVHVMRPNVTWETPKVRAAFKASDALFLEISNIDEASAAQPMILQMGMDQAHPLSSKISKEDIKLLDGAAKQMGMPGEAAFEPMQPWLAYVTLSVVPMVKAGYDPASGIDNALLLESKKVGKPVKGFETISSQLHLLADFPQADQVLLLHEELGNLAKSTTQMDQMVNDWKRGDIEAIGKLENAETAAKYPALYKRLIVDRNRQWADTLDGLLKDEHTGTLFVVVGAAHLAGPDSVQKMLEVKGYTVARQ